MCQTEHTPLSVVTIKHDPDHILSTPAQSFPTTPEGLKEAQDVIQKLMDSAQPLLPIAGLAAPQIGISRTAFIYTWDRKAEHLVKVINPRFEPVENEKETRWEGCFSAVLGEPPLQVAKVPRYKKIRVHYLNGEGKPVTKILSGFAARVFQHEWDHLNAMVNVWRPDAEVKSFDTKEEMMEFMTSVRSQDKSYYTAPVDEES